MAQAPVEESPSVAPTTSYTGIQPYSGSTTVAQPPIETTTPITGTDSGSLMLRVQQLEADVRRLNGLLEEAITGASNCWRRRVLSVMLIWTDAWHLAPLLRSMKGWVRRVLYRLPRYQRPLSPAGRLMRRRGRRRLIERPTSWFGSERLMMLSWLSRNFSPITRLADMRPMRITGWASCTWCWILLIPN